MAQFRQKVIQLTLERKFLQRPLLFVGELEKYDGFSSTVTFFYVAQPSQRSVNQMTLGKVWSQTKQLTGVASATCELLKITSAI